MPFLLSFLSLTFIRQILILVLAAPLIQWLCLELSLLFFLPLLILRRRRYTDYLIYFIIQSTGSLIFLIGTITFPLLRFYAIVLKIGLAPFIFWLLPVISNLSWLLFFLISTIIKLGPFCLSILYCSENSLIVITLMRYAAAIFYTMNRTRLKPIIAYRSLGSYRFLLLLGYRSLLMFISVWVLYSFRFGLLCYLLGSKATTNWVLWIRFANLAGLPPGLIFIVKVIMCILFPSIFLLILLLISALLIVVYCRILVQWIV